MNKCLLIMTDSTRIVNNIRPWLMLSDAPAMNCHQFYVRFHIDQLKYKNINNYYLKLSMD